MENKNTVTTIIPTPSYLKRFVLICTASIIFALNLNSFVHVAGLIPGGFAGISLLIQRTVKKFTGLKIPYTPLYWAFNAMPVYISFRFIGKKFTFYSLIGIVLSSILKDIIPPMIITDDFLLCAVFGGIINGAAVTLCLYADAVSGGTDFIAIYFSERKGVDMWNYIFAMNACVLVTAGFMLGFEKSLYSIIFQFSSTQVLNLLYKHYQKVTMLIITEKPEELYNVIKDMTNHDATKFTGTGCYKNSEKTMLYAVVSSDEIAPLSKELKKRDENAFINILKTKELYGRFFTRVKD